MEAKPVDTSLNALLKGFQDSRLKYPQVRREAEDKLLSALVLKVQQLEAGRVAIPVEIMTADAQSKVMIDSILDRVVAIEEEQKRRRGGRPPADKEAA